MVRNFGQLIRIKLGDIGEGTKEAKLKQWHVKEGQRIKEVNIINISVLKIFV